MSRWLLLALRLPCDEMDGLAAFAAEVIFDGPKSGC